MFSTLERTWELTKQSFAVLRADKEILLFPVMSAIAAIVVMVSFFVPLAVTGAFQRLTEGQGAAGTYFVLFLFYFANYFVIVFFNCALVACANIRLSGGDPTVADGLRLAWARLGRIAAWALVAATVGVILRSLEDRYRGLGRFVIGLIGVAWTLVTYFIVPVIVLEDLPVFASIKRSAEIFRRQWGAEVAGSFGFGLLSFLFAIPGILIGILGFAIHPAVGLVGVVLAVVYFLLLATVFSALRGIFTVALYRYATQGQVPAGFSPELVEGAFAPKSRRW